MLDSGAEGPGFKLQPRRCNNLSQTVHTHRASVHQAAKLAAALLMVARVTAGLAESNGSGFIYDSYHLQADYQEPGSAPEPYAWLSSMGYVYLPFCIGDHCRRQLWGTGTRAHTRLQQFIFFNFTLDSLELYKI